MDKLFIIASGSKILMFIIKNNQNKENL